MLGSGGVGSSKVPGRGREKQQEEERKDCGHKTRRQTDNKQRGSDVCDAPVIQQRVSGVDGGTRGWGGWGAK